MMLVQIFRLSPSPTLAWCIILCLPAANLCAEGWRVDALCQDAGWDQWEPRRGWGAGQRLMLQTPRWQLLINFFPVHSTHIAHYTTLASNLSTYYNMNWPEEMCRARRDRRDSFRRVLYVFLETSRRLLEYLCRNNECGSSSSSYS